ncbi:TetR/AcrR family transcriptional regulator [Paenibacillus peoriae]|uniref:TetR/AcrR family transcriptional regulator n=1 Tax=Paenibacillus peoriae TaxID=59893 RepID=UPI00026C623A|nr:TetR/AcrR family transcriptional regulator [Paenibacillus peoriae]MEC0184606.1 TetR/AcrR family transcriptional regulator [Paenibacillus peoriae]
MTTSRRSARQRILDVASDLFYREGIRSIGVDTIAEKSGASKATLYRHFPTKDDLIVAYLQEKSELSLKQFDKLIEQYKGSPKEQIFAFINAISDSLTEPEYRGCSFLNAYAEFSDIHHPVQRLVLEYNHELRSRLIRLTKDAGVQDENLADQLLLVINGAFSIGPILGANGPAAQLKVVTTFLMDLHLKH